MKITKLVSVFILSILFLTSCNSDDGPIQGPLGAYESGFFVLNEGNFGSGNASITYVSDDYATIDQSVFRGANGRALGDTAQSIFMYDDQAYIVLNGSDKIEVVNRYTMESVVTIDGDDIENPRYIVENNGMGYVSNWGDTAVADDDFISVFDLTSNTITKTITVGEGPEKMLVVGNNLYVVLNGGWNNNNKIAVIDTSTNLLITEIEVGDQPNSMSLVGTDLYVLSSGISYPAIAETAGRIDKIDLNLNVVSKTWYFSDVTKHPSFLNKSGDIFYYYLRGNIYQWDGDNELPINAENGLNGHYYGVLIEDGLLYALDAGDYTSEGTLKIFDLNDNTEINNIKVGLIPNSVQFN